MAALRSMRVYLDGCLEIQPHVAQIRPSPISFPSVPFPPHKIEMFHLARLILGWLVACHRSMRVHLVGCREMLSVTSRLPVLVVVFLDVPQIRWAYTI